MSWSRPRPYQAGAPESCPPHLGRATRQPSVRRVAPPLLRSLRRSSRRYERIRQLGGGVHSPPYYFGVYLDVPPITVRADRVRAELGLELTSMEQGYAKPSAVQAAPAAEPGFLMRKTRCSRRRSESV